MVKIIIRFTKELKNICVSSPETLKTYFLFTPHRNHTNVYEDDSLYVEMTHLLDMKTVIECYALLSPVKTQTQ